MTEDNVRHRKRILRRSYVFNTNATNEKSNSLFIAFNDNQPSQQQHTLYVRKKAGGLICSICGGPAHGYNFDAITCESCKAFFRRNALKSNGVFQCRVNDGRCIVTISTRKRCKACRLAKCFEQGMRADWILTDEERVIKQQKIEENRRLRQTIYPEGINEIEFMQTKVELTNNLYEILSSKDLIKVQQIQQAYIDSVRLTSLSPEIPSYPQSVQITEMLYLVNLATNIQATRLITYFKLLPEFSSLNHHDKLILIKYNTFTLTLMRSALNYDPLTDTYHEPNTDDCVFSGRDVIQSLSLQQYERATYCVQNLQHASLNDRFLLQVLLIIILFSKGSSVCIFANEPEPIAQDIVSIYEAQNIFINLLWKYCVNKFGFITTTKLWLKLTILSMNAHVISYNTRRDYVNVNPVVDQLLPLMKSLVLTI